MISLINTSMDYHAIYIRLCERAKTRTLTGHHETHRIIPGCHGGIYEPTNIALLTPEEHFVAHQLLVKIYPHDHLLAFALSRMAGKGAKQQARSNKRYGWIRKKFAESISKINKGRKFPNRILSEKHKQSLSNLMINRIWVTNGVESQRIYEDQLDQYIANGWRKGRSSGQRKPKI